MTQNIPSFLSSETPVGQTTRTANCQEERPQKKSFITSALSVLNSSHLMSLKRKVRWGTTDDFTTSFLHFSLFSTAFWNLANSRPVHSLMLSCHLFFCLPCLFPPFTVPCKMVFARPDEWETCPYH